jgi:hypothetical protein
MQLGKLHTNQIGWAGALCFAAMGDDEAHESGVSDGGHKGNAGANNGVASGGSKAVRAPSGCKATKYPLPRRRPKTGLHKSCTTFLKFWGAPPRRLQSAQL